MNNLTVITIAIHNELDALARECDPYEYGLPVYTKMNDLADIVNSYL